jgi:flagellar FliL protein
MADRTTEARNGREGAATAEATPAAEGAETPAAPKRGIHTWLPLIVTLVVMPLLAFATTKYVLVPQMRKGMALAVPAAAPSTGKQDPDAISPGATNRVLVPLSKILVNVAGTAGTRYLMTSVTLVGSDVSFKSKVEENKDQLMDLATGTLCTKTITDLEKPGARNLIRAELMTVFNNALGGPIVQELYITELAIQ